jgi:hypothetical protein
MPAASGESATIRFVEIRRAVLSANPERRFALGRTLDYGKAPAIARTAFRFLQNGGKYLISRSKADVAELVDARDLKSLDGNVVWVRLPPPAPMSFNTRYCCGERNRKAFN